MIDTTVFVGICAVVGIVAAVLALKAWSIKVDINRRGIDEMIRSTTHRPPPPPMPKVKPARTEVQVLPANVDRLILSYPEFLSAEQRVQMQKLLKDTWEDDTRKVIVLEGGIKIEAVMLRRGEIYKDEDMDILRSRVEPTKPWRTDPDRPKPLIPQPGTGR